MHSKDIDLGLERVSQVAKSLDVLKPAPFIITLSGTNGKGSSLAFLSSILQAAGLKVGSYTSPHLLRFNERIQINSVPLADQEIIKSFVRINKARGEHNLTFFEFTTLAALDCFAQADLDVVLLEVGLGGRLDAVNIVDADAALITELALDHKDWLGDNLEQIGLEKAGIMRADKLAVCSALNPPKSIAKYAQEVGAELLLAGKEFSYKIKDSSWDFKFGDQTLADLPLPSLVGEFQLQNAAGVLALLLTQTSVQVGGSAIKSGLQNASHAGRLQKLNYADKHWLLDVAHNPQAAQALANYLAAQKNIKWTAIFAALDDKDIASMVPLVKPYIVDWLVVDLNEPRATTKEDLVDILLGQAIEQDKISAFKSMSLALDKVKNSASENILVFGSFVTVAQALEEIGS